MKLAKNLERGNVIDLNSSASYILPENKRATECFWITIGYVEGTESGVTIYSKTLPFPQYIPGNETIDDKDLTGFKNVEFE